MAFMDVSSPTIASASLCVDTSSVAVVVSASPCADADDEEGAAVEHVESLCLGAPLPLGFAWPLSCTAGSGGTGTRKLNFCPRRSRLEATSTPAFVSSRTWN
eukprot:CAMPEP_0172784372 /NCGR_PEP_ID=MMETSP1074-20121228/204908_1 /TAXON_ID=2916 /ORGANISM="Ceratium fusus, Strain PA161109" /LENGTH=101 /DNA_ID=CAMNT_0013621375 /DNA_START=196 /DNA_END=501 /DNA_ORIENTATION=-